MAKMNEYKPEEMLFLLVNACYDEAHNATQSNRKYRERLEREVLRRLGGNWERYIEI